jgi:hypothetical protein
VSFRDARSADPETINQHFYGKIDSGLALRAQRRTRAATSTTRQSSAPL